MPNFRYQALNAQQQALAGELEAPSVSQAIVQLEAAGLTVQSIGYATPETSANESPSRVSPPVAPGIEQAALTSHLEQVIERGRSLSPALHAYAAEMPSGRTRRQLDAVLRILDAGGAATAATAFQKLPTYWIPLLSAATSSQDPGRMLQEFLKESRRAEDLRRQWLQTLAYPAIIFCVVAAVLIFFSFLVIPIFRDIFQGFGLRLPWLTLFVLRFAEWISSGRIFIAIALLAPLVLILRWAVRRLPQAFREAVDNRFGTFLGRTTAIAQFSQFLADLFEADLGRSNALRLAGFATKSLRLRRAAWRLATEFDVGEPIDAASYRQTVTATVLHALRGDLSAASRIRLLREISSCYAERARVRLSWTRGVIEPISICLIGLIVGTIVVALFLPLLGLIQGLS